MKKEQQRFSLLWLAPEKTACFYPLDEKARENLNIKELTDYLDEYLGINTMSYLEGLLTSTEVIAYRQGILSDFISNEDFFLWFKKTIKRCFDIKNLIKFAFEREASLYNLIKRIEESEEIMNIIEEIYEKLSQMQLKSVGLIHFRSILDEMIKSDIYVNYGKDLHIIKKMDTGIRSIKVGMNLDEYLNPIEAIVLSLEEQPFKYTRTMKKVSRIIDLGIAELKALPRRIFAPETAIVKDDLNRLEKVIEPAMRQLINFCDTFNTTLLDVLSPLSDELNFYAIGTVNYKRLKTLGYPICMPTFTNEGKTVIRSLYNLNLANFFHKNGKTAKHMIFNDFELDEKGSIIVLTGANRGGKTTYTQGIGQVYWLGLMGLHVPAQQALIKMIDGLFVHFPAQEDETVDYGRLGEECQRFSDMFDKITDKSLLLMNESFSGTSHEESLIIAKESLTAVAKTNASVLYNTHLHELAAQLDSFETDEGPSFISLVAGSNEEHQSFSISKRPPLGQSYAKDIADRYGVSFEMLTKQVY